MTNKELKKLSRADLLDLLMHQTRENERLQAELDEANRQLADRRLRVSKAGSLAQAAMEVNGVMAAAEKAAAQYLENIIAIQEDTKRKSAAMLQELEEKLRDAQQREEQARMLIEQMENK